jgi:glutathione S-transferase
VSLTLHAFPLSPRSFKVLWAANHLEIPFTLRVCDFAKGDQATPAFLALNPNGRAPVLEDEGYALWESNAIVEYLASLKPDSGLLPVDARPRLAVTKWLYWDCAHWDPAGAIFAFERVVKPLFGRGEADPSEIQRGTLLFERVGKVLDGALDQHRYVAGERLTVADIALGSLLCIADQAGFPIESFRHIQRWKADLASLPSWTKTAALQRHPPAQ